MESARDKLFAAVHAMRGGRPKDGTVTTGGDHYSKAHKINHCKCWRPENWICPTHNQEYHECKCVPPVKKD